MGSTHGTFWAVRSVVDRSAAGDRTDLHTPERDVAVAERGADDLDPDLVRLGRVHDDLLDGQRPCTRPLLVIAAAAAAAATKHGQGIHGGGIKPEAKRRGKTGFGFRGEDEEF